MGDDDMIRRGDAIAKCRAMADEAKSYGMPQMAMGGYASAEAIAAIPAAEAEAEAAALRAKLARIASAWPIVRDADCSGGTLASAMDEIEAAISDGAADGGKHE